VCLGLARGAPGEDKLDWLRRAAELVDSQQAAAHLSVTIGRTLEEEGRRPAAVRHYAELLSDADSSYVADPADADRQVVGWLHAVQRIRAIADDVSPEWVEPLLARPDDDAERRAWIVRLQRLRLALGGTSVSRARSASEGVGQATERRSDVATKGVVGGARRADGGVSHSTSATGGGRYVGGRYADVLARIDLMLAMEWLPPELKLRYLPETVESTWPASLRRRLLLERWDTHVSLGMLEAARADRAAWQAEFADSEPADATQPGPITFDPLSPEDERDRVDAIDLAYRKLEQAEGTPFTKRLTRQWRMPRAELLLDPRDPLAAVGPWTLAVDRGSRRIELINVFKHQHPQRQTEDGLRAARGVTAPAADGDDDQGRRFDTATVRQNAWPLVSHGSLAAVPVPGGLVCVGLGPERYAGRRQWEYAVPEWLDVPAGFSAKAAAGPDGVFFTPRRDRVVLVGWLDGRTWWRRDLPGVVIDRLHRCGDRLVIVSEDRRVWVADATFGTGFEQVPTELITPERIDVVGETIVVWGREFVAGISSGTLERLWVRPGVPVGATATVPGRTWIAHRTRDGRKWHLLDVRTGKRVFDAPLGDFEQVSAVLVRDERLLVAGLPGPLVEGGEPSATRLAALDVEDGTPLWSRDFETRIPINVTQLAAHPDYIPVLLAQPRGRDMEEDSGDVLALQLVSRADGTPAGDPLRIGGDFRRNAEPYCEMYMLAAPTRMIVQASGNLVAYGDSPICSVP